MTTDSDEEDTFIIEKLVNHITHASAESLTDFIYSENEKILERRRQDIQHLNEKAANLLRLLGVLFTLYSGAVLVAARITVNAETEIGYDVFINQFTVTSLVLLAAAFLYAVLAYHHTNEASGPSAEYLRDELTEEMTVTEAKANINTHVVGWVQNNDLEIELDHTRLFNCKMSIFFSLAYLVIGAVFAAEFRAGSFWEHVLVTSGVIIGSYLLYERVRDRASTGASS